MMGWHIISITAISKLFLFIYLYIFLIFFRLDAASSPLPGSLSSVGTPESLSSADSPSFTFRPVDSPSPGRPVLPVTDEPMHEERQPELSKQDQVMTPVEQNPS